MSTAGTMLPQYSKFRGPQMSDQIQWNEQDHRDGMTGKAVIADIHIHVQDCDGDTADWDLKRGDEYLAMGNVVATDDDYEAAKDEAELVARSILNAEERNAFMKSGAWINRDRIDRLQEEVWELENSYGEGSYQDGLTRDRIKCLNDQIDELRK